MKSTTAYDHLNQSLPHLNADSTPTWPHVIYTNSSLHLKGCSPVDFLDLKFDGAKSFNLIDGLFVEIYIMYSTHGHINSYLQHEHVNETEREASKGGYVL